MNEDTLRQQVHARLTDGTLPRLNPASPPAGVTIAFRYVSIWVVLAIALMTVVLVAVFPPGD